MKPTLPLSALLSAIALAACQPQQADAPAASAPSASSPAPAAAAPHGASAPSAEAARKQEDPAFKADALLLLKTIEEIGTQSSLYLDSDDMRRKVEEIRKTADQARRNRLTVEIYRSNIRVYQDAVAKLQDLKVQDKETAALRDLWIKKFQTDIELFEIQIKEQDNGLSDEQLQEKYKDLYRQNRELAQDAAEQNMAFYKRTR